MMKRLLAVVGAAGIALLVASCGLTVSPSGPGEESNTGELLIGGYDASEATTLKALHAEAQSGGVADAEQLAMLSQPDITFADYELAINKTITCMKEANLQVNTEATTKHNGVDVVGYSFSGVAGQVTDEQVQDIANRCYEQHGRYVDIFWQTSSPQVTVFAEARASALHDDMLACLQKYRVDVPSGASFQELDAAAAKLMVESSESGEQAQDCYREVGYYTWQQ